MTATPPRYDERPDERHDDHRAGTGAAGEPGGGQRQAWNDGLIARRSPHASQSARPHAEGTRAAAGPYTVAGKQVTRPGEEPDGPGGKGLPWHEDGDGKGGGPGIGAGPFRQTARSARRSGGRWGAADDGGGHALPAHGFATGGLRQRLEALRELVGLSRTRLDGRTLAEAGRVLDAAAARGRHSPGHTVVALAGSTGSGKSTLFNSLAALRISESGIRRPTTSIPLSCAWTDHADGLLDRLGISPTERHRPAQPHDPSLRGLILLDLPDHDSVAPGHRERVDRLLGLVDAVVWVVDPEKYADAVLHERYLRPLAGYAEVTFVVLNQVDRLPGEAADQVLDDLRRLLDEDGIALGEHGEPGATVFAVSALTGEGVGELREMLGRFAAGCGAAERRLAADVDGAMARLRPEYVTDAAMGGISPRAREEFDDRLAEAAGAEAAGQAAERAWLRDAGRVCGVPWARLGRRHGADGRTGGVVEAVLGPGAVEPITARPAVDEAVRMLGDVATEGLPAPWAQAVREAAGRGGRELPQAIDDAVAGVLLDGQPARPSWWSVAAMVQLALLVIQVIGTAWLLGAGTGMVGGVAWWIPALLGATGVLGGPLVSWCCGLAARGPARRRGQAVELRMREAAAECGRARVLEPMVAELMRYQEVRERYVIAAGSA